MGGGHGKEAKEWWFVLFALKKASPRNLANGDGHTTPENDFRARNYFGLGLKRNKLKDKNDHHKHSKKKSGVQSA